MANRLTYIMQQILPYIWSKYGLKPLPQYPLESEEIESLRRAVHVQTFVARKEWQKYLHRHTCAMTQDQASFCRYTAFACYLELETYKNDFDRYIRLIALVSYFALYCNTKGATTAYLHVEPLLEKLFYAEMSHVGADITFWKELNYFIIRKRYLELHLEVEKMLHGGKTKKYIVREVTKSPILSFLNLEPTKKGIASVHNSDFLSNIDARTIEKHHLSNQVVCALDKMIHRESDEAEVYAQKKLPFSMKLETIQAVGKELSHISLQTSVFANYLDIAQTDLKYKYDMKRRLLEVPFMGDVDLRSVSHVLRSIQNPVKAVD